MTAATLVDDEMRAWIGRSDPPRTVEISRRDIVKYAIATEQRLDKYRRGDEAPPMFLFGAMMPLTALEDLGPDGLRRDPLLPPLPLARIMAGGVRQRYHRPIVPGDVLTVTRTLADLYEKRGASGPLLFVVYEIAVTDREGGAVMNETQTRIVR